MLHIGFINYLPWPPWPPCHTAENSLGPVVTGHVDVPQRGQWHCQWSLVHQENSFCKTVARGKADYCSVLCLCQVCIEDKQNFWHSWQRAAERKEPHLWKTLFLAAVWNEELLQKHLLFWRLIIFKVLLLIVLQHEVTWSVFQCCSGNIFVWWFNWRNEWIRGWGVFTCMNNYICSQ